VKTIYLHELKQNARTAIIWIVSLVGGTGLYMSLYPAFASHAGELNKVLQNYPPVLRKALNINFDAHFALASFFALVMGFITLAAAIQAMNLSTAITSKEERDKTAEFLLSKPLTRQSILTGKLAAAATIILTTNVVFLVSMRLLLMAISKTSLSEPVFLLMGGSMLLVQVFFLALGLVMSVSLPKVRSVLSVSLVTVFAFYIVGMLDAVLGAKAVRYLTPFKFFDLIYVYKHSSYEWQYLVVEVVFVIAAAVAGYVIYQRRDINTI
jgi:ABC-2 type transport system permease protein